MTATKPKINKKRMTIIEKAKKEVNKSLAKIPTTKAQIKSRIAAQTKGRDAYLNSLPEEMRNTKEALDVVKDFNDTIAVLGSQEASQDQKETQFRELLAALETAKKAEVTGGGEKIAQEMPEGFVPPPANAASTIS